MRIAYISLMGGLPWGGSEALWCKKAIESLAKGDEVFVSVFDWGKETNQIINELKKKGAQIHLRQRFSHDIPFFKKFINFFKNRIKILNNYWNSLIDFKPEHVFINQGANLDLVLHYFDLYLKLKQNNIKYTIICHSHNQFSFLPDNNIYPRGKDVFENAQNVWFVSNRQKQLTERTLCLNLKNAIIFKNPLNLKQNIVLAYPNDEIVQMAIVGAIVSGKGHDTLFEVLSKPQWKNRKWHLNIYGKGYGLNYLKDLAEFLGIFENITFHGHVNSATEIWENNQILLIPSEGEGLPISLVEAAISGRTAVVTDVGGNTEIIEDNISGFVACAPTPHSFSEALERAWDRKDEWENIGKNLSIEISEHYRFY